MGPQGVGAGAGGGTGTEGHGLPAPPLPPPPPQGWHTAATCPRCGPTCQRWCITTSSHPPGHRGPRGASPRTCGASIKRTKRCTLWGARDRGWLEGLGASRESRPACSVSGLHRPHGRSGKRWSRVRGERPGLMALECLGQGRVSQLGLWVSTGRGLDRKSVLLLITPQP